VRIDAGGTSFVFLVFEHHTYNKWPNSHETTLPLVKPLKYSFGLAVLVLLTTGIEG
jgi:hypothetical protein